jgi:hypothetical protein
VDLSVASLAQLGFDGGASYKNVCATTVKFVARLALPKSVRSCGSFTGISRLFAGLGKVNPDGSVWMLTAQFGWRRYADKSSCTCTKEDVSHML